MIDGILRSKQKDETHQQGELIRDVILPKNRLRNTKKPVTITDIYSSNS